MREREVRYITTGYVRNRMVVMVWTARGDDRHLPWKLVHFPRQEVGGRSRCGLYFRRPGCRRGHEIRVGVVRRSTYGALLGPLLSPRAVIKQLAVKAFPTFDQQAIETMAMVLMHFQAYQIFRVPQYVEKMFLSYKWFLGENTLRAPLYDHETKGCCDGLLPTGINRNQGAESTLAYLISHLTVLEAFELEYEYNRVGQHATLSF